MAWDGCMSPSYRELQFETSLRTNSLERSNLVRVSISDYLIQRNRLGSLDETTSRVCDPLLRVWGCLRHIDRDRIKSVVISRMDRWESKGSLSNEPRRWQFNGQTVPHKPYKPRIHATAYALTLFALCGTVHWVNVACNFRSWKYYTDAYRSGDRLGRGIEAEIWSPLRSMVKSHDESNDRSFVRGIGFLVKRKIKWRR